MLTLILLYAILVTKPVDLALAQTLIIVLSATQEHTSTKTLVCLNALLVPFKMMNTFPVMNAMKLVWNALDLQSLNVMTVLLGQP